MSIYGEQLSFFPELMMSYDIFSMDVKPGSGYVNKKVLFSVIGYLSRLTGGKEGIQGENRVENQRANLWVVSSSDSIVIPDGTYLEDNGEVYTFVNDAVFVREAGFARHDLQLVVTFDGRQKPNNQTAKTVINDY